jgi:5'-nucleotidase (lipoprotein e(P4) family)
MRLLSGMQKKVILGRAGNPIFNLRFHPDFLYLSMKILKGFSGILLLSLTFLITTSNRQSSAPITKDPRLNATAWFAVSAERHAIYLQTYKLAGLHISFRRDGRQKAIVADLDETVLDNSSWALRVLLEGKEYPTYWDEWEKAAIAPAFPGAVEFFQAAANAGMQVFYVSNRSAKNLNYVLKNLNMHSLPFADSAHVLLKENTSSKIQRRRKIESEFDIALLLGDNLADFDDEMENANTTRRHLAMEKNMKNWGKRFIIFPNPMYGSWEDAMMGYRYNLSEASTDSAWRATLEPYSKMMKW